MQQRMFSIVPLRIPYIRDSVSNYDVSVVPLRIFCIRGSASNYDVSSEK